jgi:anthranilate phosphoribosyltransferase
MRDTAVLNAAAAIIAGKLADRMEDSLRMAEQSIDEGRAMEKLEKLVEVSNKLAKGNK